MKVIRYSLCSNLYRKLLIFQIISLVSLKLQASDILGSDLSWISAGKDSIIISCDLYADCRTSMPTQIVMTFRYLATSAFIRQEVFSLKGSTDITAACAGQCTKCMTGCSSFGYGIKKLTFTKLVVFSNLQDCEILFYPNAQTRPYSINTGPGGQGFYTYAILNHCVADSNRSPIFTLPPALVCCATSDVVFDPGTLNPAVDSLVFSLVKPLSDSANFCTFSGQFSYEKPLEFLGFPDKNLNFPQGFHLDTETGIVTFRPMKTGESIFSVRVEIFRNGVKIGETRREYGVISLSCPLNNFPLISGQTLVSACVGSTFRLSFQTSDIDYDDTVSLQCIHQLSNVSWTSNNGQTRLPSGNLIWTPSPADMLKNPHVLYILAKDNNCPLGAQTARKVVLYVWPDTIKSDISVTKYDCGTYSFSAKPLNVGKKNYHSEWYYGGHLISSLDSFNFKFKKPGNYTVEYRLLADSSCGSPKLIVFQTDTFIYTELPADTHLCFGDSMTIIPKVFFPSGRVSYLWSNNDTASEISTGVVTNNTTYWVTVTDSFCSSTDSIDVYAGDFIFFYTIPDLCENEDSLDLDQFVSPKGGKWSCSDNKFLKGHHVYPSKAGQGSYLLKYEVIDPASSCYSVDSVWVQVNSVPTVSTLKIPPLCRNSPPLDLSLYGFPAGGEWSCNVSSAEKNNILYPDKLYWGNYKLYYTVYNQYGCSNTDTQSFNVNNTVNMTLNTEDSKTSYCSDHAKIKLIATPSGGNFLSSPSWIVDSCYLNPAAISSDSFKTVSVIYHYKHSSGCEVEKSLNINILHHPEIALDKSHPASCTDTVLLHAINRYSSGVEWTPVSGEASGKSSDRFFPYLYYYRNQQDIDRGYFKISAKTLVQSNLCAARSDTLKMMFYSGPAVSFSMSDTLVFVDSPVYFQDMTVSPFYPIKSWNWQFGDGGQSNSQNPVHYYSHEGEFSVSLSVADQNDCDGFASNKIKVKKFGNLTDHQAAFDRLKVVYSSDRLLLIEIPPSVQVSAVRLINVLGQELIIPEMMNNRLIIKKEGLQRGCYFLVVTDDSGRSETLKLIF